MKLLSQPEERKFIAGGSAGKTPPVAGILLLALLLTVGLTVNWGFFSWPAFACLVMANIFCILLCLDSFRRRCDRWLCASSDHLLVLMVLGFMFAGFILPAGLHQSGGAAHKYLIHGLGAAAFALAAVYFWGESGKRGRLIFGVLLAIAAAMRILMLFSSPSPVIDVFAVQERGGAMLMRGENPYNMALPSPYPGEPSITTFPYPPLILLANAASRFLFHDPRGLWVACDITAGIFIYLTFAAANRQAKSRRRGQLLALAFLYFPRSLFVIEQAWIEPLAAATLGLLTLLAAKARGGAVRGVALGLLLGSKQYIALAAPMILKARLVNLKGWIIAGIVGVSIAAPFLASDFRAVIDGALVALAGTAPRLDGLSWQALALRLGFGVPWLITVLLWLGATAFFTYKMLPGLSGMLLAAACGWLCFFSVGLQAFINYYYLVIYALLLSVAAAPRGEAETASLGALARTIKRHLAARIDRRLGLQAEIPRDSIDRRTSPLSWVDLALGVALLAGVLCLYSATAAETVTGEDSGELIGAAYCLGIPHPSGYPLWTLLAHLAIKLIPFGSAAYRVAMASSIMTAFTAALIFLCIRLMGAGRAAALFGAAALAVSTEIWSQSVIAEVYALNCLLVVLTFFFLINWALTDRLGCLLLAALSLGLGLANHMSIGPIGLACGVWALCRKPSLLRSPTALIAGAACLLAPLLIYIYLPLRAQTDPPVNWGDPATFSAMVFHVLRKQYPVEALKNPRDFFLFLRQLIYFAQLLVEQFSPAVVWLALIGGVGLMTRYAMKSVRWLTLLVFLVASLGYILSLNYKMEREEMHVVTVFFIPAYAMAAIMLGLGADMLFKTAAAAAPKYRRLSPGLIAVVFLLLAFPAVAHFKANNMSNYTVADDFAANLLKTMEPDAIFFPDADHATFPLIYRQVVLGERQDVVIADKYGYIEPAMYRHSPFAAPSHILAPPDRRVIEAWIITHTDRPIYFSSKRDMDDLPGCAIHRTGLLFRVYRPGETPRHFNPWLRYTWRLPPGEGIQDYTECMIAADTHYALACESLRKQDTVEAFGEFKKAAFYAEGIKEFYNNIGCALAEERLSRAAEEYYRMALKIDRGYLSAIMNLALVYLRDGEREKAMEFLRAEAALNAAQPKIAQPIIARLNAIAAGIDAAPPAAGPDAAPELLSQDPRQALSKSMELPIIPDPRPKLPRLEEEIGVRNEP